MKSADDNLYAIVMEEMVSRQADMNTLLGDMEIKVNPARSWNEDVYMLRQAIVQRTLNFEHADRLLDERNHQVQLILDALDIKRDEARDIDTDVEMIIQRIATWKDRLVTSGEDELDQVCPQCDGSGLMPDNGSDKEINCDYCGGTGEVSFEAEQNYTGERDSNSLAQAEKDMLAEVSTPGMGAEIKDNEGTTYHVGDIVTCRCEVVGEELRAYGGLYEFPEGTCLLIVELHAHTESIVVVEIDGCRDRYSCPIGEWFKGE